MNELQLMEIDYYSILSSMFHDRPFSYSEARHEIIEWRDSFNPDVFFELTRYGIVKIIFRSSSIKLKILSLKDFTEFQTNGGLQ